MRKGIYLSFLPGETPEEKFAAAAKYGFASVEIPTLTTPEERQRHLAAARENGIRISSVMNQAHWGCPMSDPDPDVRAKSVEGMFQSLDTAVAVGADAVLLVPAVVKPDVTYERAWEVSQNEIARLIPAYAEHKVYIACENVWNKFLLSPTDFANYIDDFDTDWVAAYFDVGNIVLYGYPEQWIATLGRRIKKVHIKGYNFDRKAWCSLLGGTINWKAVMTTLKAVGYNDVLTAELAGDGDTPEAKVTNISTDMDQIIAMY